MIAPNVKEYDLEFRYSLVERYETDLIIIHHTGNPWDDDCSAEDIHRSHLAQGWSGIGYHYVIRKNGTIEEGRPEWAKGAHAEDDNWHSVGIHVSGNCNIGVRTQAQIESLAYLVGYLCDKYDLIPTAETVKGHRDVDATACPGDNLYDILQTIRGKAIWYMQHYQGGD